MRIRITHILIGLVILSCEELALGQNWANHSFSSGWCYIQSTHSPLVRNVHYAFDDNSGDLTLMADGSWTVIYSSAAGGGGDKVNIPLVDTTTVTGSIFYLTLHGRNLTSYVWLPNVSVQGEKSLKLHLHRQGGTGGSIPNGTEVRAPNFVMEDSVIDGDVGGIIRVQRVRNHYATNRGLQIDGDLSSTGLLHTELSTSGTINITGDCPGTIDIDGALVGSIDIAGTWFGSIAVAGDLSGSLDIGSSPTDPLAGSLHVGGTCAGTVSVTGNLSGPLTIDQHLSGTISVRTISGDLHVGADLAAGGRITGSGGLNAEIQIDGSLFNGAGNEIHITGTMGSEGAVAVDYDGFEPEDSWHDDASVRIGDDTYYASTAAARVYEITCLRGDMDNDDDVDSFDIDPFVLALTNPEEYDADYPGLGGSRYYHADADCDGDVDSFDVDPFVLRMTDPDEYHLQYPDCEAGCLDRGEGGSPGPTEPADVAALLRESVAPERLPVLVSIARELAGEYRGTPRGHFWAAILAGLES